MMKFTEALLIMAVLFHGREALKCYNCKEVKFNGKVAESSNDCKGSETTCVEPENSCKTTKLSYKIGMAGQLMEGETVATKCAMNLGEKAACAALKNLLTGKGSPLEDFKCEAKFCNSDLCSKISGK